MYRTAPAHAQTLVIIDVGFDDARFDHYLAYRNVQLRNDSAQLVEAILGLVGDDVVGAFINGDRTALVDLGFGAGHRLEQLGDIGCLGVVDLQQFAPQRRQLGDLFLRFQLLTLTGGNFFRRGHKQDIANHALVQTLGFQHQVERLIPRDILQAQRNAALHCVAGDQIEVGEVGDQLQHGTYVNVLEIQRKLFAGVGEPFSIALVQVIHRHRANADGQLVVGLIGGVVEGTAGLDGDRGAVTGGAGVDELHRGREILHVQAHPQRLGQLGAGETENDLAIALLNIRGNGRVGQIDDHVPFTLGAALEIDTTNGLAHRCVGSGGGGDGGGRARRSRFGGSSGGRVNGTPPNHHKQIIALDPRGVRGHLRQVDDQPRTILGLHHRGAAGITGTEVASFVRQLADHAGQIESNPRRLFSRVAMGCRRGCIERQLQLDAISRQRGNVQRFEVGRLYHR